LDIPTTEKSKLILTRNIGFKHVSVLGDKLFNKNMDIEGLGGPLA